MFRFYPNLQTKIDGPCAVQVNVYLSSQQNETTNIVPNGCINQSHSQPIASISSSTSHLIQRTAHSFSVSPAKSFLVSPLKQTCLTLSSLRFTNNHSFVSSLPICANYLPSTSSDISSNMILTFLMTELNTISDIIKVLKHRGFHILTDCKFQIIARANNYHFDSENTYIQSRNFFVLLKESKNETLGSFF